ncbi:hypothetical protein VPH35_074630 [Triticum aestivum]
MLNQNDQTNPPPPPLLSPSPAQPHPIPRSLDQIQDGSGGRGADRAGGGVRRARAEGGRRSRGSAIHRAGQQPPAAAAAAGVAGDPLVGPAPAEEGPGGAAGREARGR